MHRKQLIRAIPLCCPCLTSVGCAVVYKPKIKPVQLPDRNPLDLRVQVHFTEAFLDAEWRGEFMTDTYLLPVGNVLKENTLCLAKSVFRDTIVTEGGRQELVDAVPTPTVVSIDRTLGGGFAFSRADTVLSVEWELVEPAGGLV